MIIHPHKVPEGIMIAVLASQVEYDDLRSWLRCTYGKDDLSRYIDKLEYGELIIRDAKDLTLFLLKWHNKE